MRDRQTLFLFTFSLVVGSLVMIILNVIFYGSNFATMFLAASTAVNLAILLTTYWEDTKELMRKLFTKK